jgi:hypothetical protein
MSNKEQQSNSGHHLVPFEDGKSEQEYSHVHEDYEYTNSSDDVPKNVVNVTIGSDMNEIVPMAFQDCTELEYVVMLPNSNIKIIGVFGFQNCTSLTSISIPESVTELHWCAFQGCKSLTSVYLPDSLTLLDTAFHDCTSLQTINIPKPVTRLYETFKGCTSLISMTIPDTVTHMGFTFEKCTSLININIPPSVIRIVDAFEDCESLTTIAITNPSIYISDDFINCTLLNQRRHDGINYNIDTSKWLLQRFNDLPIHQACYDAKVTPEKLSSLILYDNEGTVSSTDAMNMTALHILCSNPNVNAELIRIVKCAIPKAVVMTDLAGMIPIDIFIVGHCVPRLYITSDN